MNNTVTPLNAPTAIVKQMEEQSIDPSDELTFTRYSYGFHRRVRWKVFLQWYMDQQFEVMPQQLLRIEEFVITRDRWTQDEIAMIEAFVDAHNGSAYPFLFTAPDNGQTYQVRFRDDLTEYTTLDALYRSGELTLVYAGDLDNTINNGLVYPAYVESTTTTTTTSTSTTTNTGSFSFSDTTSFTLDPIIFD